MPDRYAGIAQFRDAVGSLLRAVRARLGGDACFAAKIADLGAHALPRRLSGGDLPVPPATDFSEKTGALLGGRGLLRKRNRRQERHGARQTNPSRTHQKFRRHCPIGCLKCHLEVPAIAADAAE
jgi:hypothetical protein